MATTNDRVFCDESGHTGSRLLEAEQPFCVYAFMLLPEEAVKTAADTVTHIDAAEGIEPHDLKFSTLRASASGLRRYARIGLSLAQTQATICVLVVETRDQACVLVVEAFLDPAYNSYAPPAAAARDRRWLADHRYGCVDDTTLARFLAALTADDVAVMQRVGEVIAGQFAWHPNTRALDAVQRIKGGLKHSIRCGARRPHAPLHHHLPAGQQAALFPGLVQMDAIFQPFGIEAHLVCDEDRPFGQVLRHTFEEAVIAQETPMPERAMAPTPWPRSRESTGCRLVMPSESSWQTLRKAWSTVWRWRPSAASA